jgi:NAD(P)-dependent dehydrogenase (short-subunit alcohol dehydrogenase family)
MAGQRFADKVALVTGGGAGIGRATVRRMTGEGARVVVLERDAAAAARVADEAGPACVVCEGDATREADVATAVAAAVALGGLDILVNNAGATWAARFEDCSPEAWDREFDVTLRSAVLCCRAVLPVLRTPGAAVVNVGSVNGLMYFGNPAYSAAKAGLLSLTRSLAVEYGQAGIRVNMVSPGSVRTEAATWRDRAARDPAIFERIARWYPLGRVGEPDDIAAAIAFLASDEAAFVSGANLVVDGGLTAGMGMMAAELAG